MKICFFGIFDPLYSRNRVLISGFKEKGWDVTECRVDPKKNRGLKKYFLLYLEYRKIRNQNFKIVLVAFPGHTVVWLARILFGKRIVFDFFLSLYNSNVEDRKLYGKRSLKGAKDWLLDYTGLCASPVILLDTARHINYISNKFSIPKDKFIRVFVGSDPSIFKPEEEVKGDKFIVHFHGTHIPLQGIEYIIKAAHALSDREDIVFRIIGNGQTSEKVRSLARELNIRNIEFIDSISINKLSECIRGSSISLGIFGGGIKAGIVIPNKIYESIASRKAVITRKSAAINELFEDRKNILCVEPEDPEDLAQAIIFLKDNPTLRESIAEEGFRLFAEKLTPKKIVSHLIEDIYGLEKAFLKR